MYYTDTRTRSLTNATFAVVVSDSSQTQTFNVDRELCHQRQTVLSEQLQASETVGHQPIVLQGEYDLDGFESYVEYVNSEGEVFPAFDNGDRTILPLLRLHVVAHQLRDYTAANNLIDEIMEVSDRHTYWPNPTEITYAWETQVEDSPLRSLFVDYQIHEMRYNTLVLTNGDVPFEYMRDVARGFAKIVEQ
jgi:hypothetical protein